MRIYKNILENYMLDWLLGDEMDITDVGEAIALMDDEGQELCPRCGHPLEDGFCSACGYPNV